MIELSVLVPLSIFLIASLIVTEFSFASISAALALMGPGFAELANVLCVEGWGVN